MQSQEYFLSSDLIEDSIHFICMDHMLIASHKLIMNHMQIRNHTLIQSQSDYNGILKEP